jgi:hypothetical protein
MNFTRDPIIETIVTPKEGNKLVIRSSKGGGQEEFFVDSVQVILIGQNCFYRSLEKPKPFLVPAHDYEILEVRETRMVMKMPGAEKGGIKIGGGREAHMKAPRELREEEEPISEKAQEEAPTEERPAPTGERRKEKKRFRRGRRDRFEKGEEGEKEEGAQEGQEPPVVKPTFIIPPPSTLISETIARYKDIPGFASAFFEKDKQEEAPLEEAPMPGEEVSTPSAPSEENRGDEEFFI